MEELFEWVRKIPRGHCASYGTLGGCLDRRVSGLVIGRWMAHAPEGVPWWRVVAKDGRLPICKISPNRADEQRAHLENEGVEFVEDLVAPRFLMSAEELESI